VSNVVIYILGRGEREERNKEEITIATARRKIERNR
jgi:hypothetical protein